MDKLINIDNGGTLTDICVATGDGIAYAKTLTTPNDLSECLFRGMAKVSEQIYGEENLPELLASTEIIRYSSTQGTNALVQRRGPKIGVITDEAALVERLNYDETTTSLWDDLVGERVQVIGQLTDRDEMDQAFVQAINALTNLGAERLVVAIADRDAERAYKHIMFRRFPRQLLGSVPALFSWEFTNDDNRVRRIWSALLNSYLHPTVERLLYSAEHRLRGHKVRNPLLIYRNDGASSRVAKSVALKTYSSGPRAGLEATRALAEAYDADHLVMIDIGGTTTDVGVVEGRKIATDHHGKVAGIATSIELSDVYSAGVGGCSVIAAKDGKIQVGPDSVGAAPGPACFGFGGESATITDANLLLGVLDPDTYLNGEMRLDRERAKAAVMKGVAEPLGMSLEKALVAMEQTYAQHVADSFKEHVRADGSTTLATFGSGGPMTACAAARLAGVKNVIIPRLAAVFSAFGVSFSDVAQTFVADIGGLDAAALQAVRDDLEQQATRAMFQEGYALDDCELRWTLVTEQGDDVARQDAAGDVDTSVGSGERKLLELEAVHEMPHPPVVVAEDAERVDAVTHGTRRVLAPDEGEMDAPVYLLDDQPAHAASEGPAVIEGPYITVWIPSGWQFQVSNAGDLVLTDTTQN